MSRKGRPKEARIVASSRAAGMVATAAPGASRVAGSARPRQVTGPGAAPAAGRAGVKGQGRRSPPEQQQPQPNKSQ